MFASLCAVVDMDRYILPTIHATLKGTWHVMLEAFKLTGSGVCMDGYIYM